MRADLLEGRDDGPGDDELRIAPTEADLHGARGEFTGDLACGVGQRLEKHQPAGRFEGSGQALGELPSLLTAGVGGDSQLVPEFTDILREIHDTMVTPLWCQVNRIDVNMVSP
jgi:hypothetical protein